MSLREFGRKVFAEVPAVGSPEWTAWVAKSEDLKARVDAVWALVAPEGHWKGPIDALVPGPVALRVSVDDIRYAVEFLTATEPVVELRPYGGYHVTSPGYAAGPAGDH